MDLAEDWNNECRCSNRLHAGNKPLERRRRREHQRCEAHSLVGTPNYIAPEVRAAAALVPRGGRCESQAC